MKEWFYYKEAYEKTNKPMAQQTAVDWFADNIDDLISDELRERVELLKNEAKQMEKEQRINAQMDMFHHINDLYYSLDYLNRREAAIKYAEDYSTRLQNETN